MCRSRNLCYLADMDKGKIKEEKQWTVYLLECADGTLYCGVTTDLSVRLLRHNQGTASKYTRSRRPVVCVAQSPPMDKSSAFSLEYRVKRLPKAKKEMGINQSGGDKT